MKRNVLVLMSTYNGENYIKEQIDSIMKQGICGDVILRIRDDGSTDGTVECIYQCQNKYGDRIKLIIGENKGYNASYFELIHSVAKADIYDYYAFSDQDDVWLESKLEIAARELDKVQIQNGKDSPLLYASTSYLVHDDLKPYGQTRRKQRPLTIYNTAIQNICPGHTQVMNEKLLRLIQDQKVDPSRIYVYDSWITSQAALYGKIVFNNSSFTFYRQHKGNQLGSGAGKLGQIMASIKRNESGDGYKYRKQVEYLVEMDKNELRRQGYYDELSRFIHAKSLKEKAVYLSRSKLYRQNRIESAVFHIAVLSGKY